ncbi:phosphoribosylanthranilate isomerase [Phenylobacterium ferrooxidans]|uniref:N-(5'-phosphoribosyl)anthranilate isomerase n=1 Tax=Phenylobacterium ferrooxidans TaxID=2982689 RepID=A0ABW6CWR9_9CAUL
MTVPTKICGLSTPETVSAAVAGGVSHIGFMFFDKSPRNITPDAAERLTAEARARNVKIVAVTVDPDDELVDRLAAILKPDLFQLHGAETPARARAVAARTGAGIIKALSISNAHDLSAAKAYEAAADHLMFDAKAPQDSELPGGNGARFDWTLMMGHRFQRPWFLAGGLDPWNVVDAVRLSGAPMVDVSSGVERGPGLKDPALITAFLEAVRRA